MSPLRYTTLPLCFPTLVVPHLNQLHFCVLTWWSWLEAASVIQHGHTRFWFYERLGIDHGRARPTTHPQLSRSTCVLSSS